MLMLSTILFPILAGAALYIWKPADRRWRQDYVLFSAIATAGMAILSIFNLLGEGPFTLLQLNVICILARRKSKSQEEQKLFLLMEGNFFVRDAVINI